jgi:RNA polymerase sigma factor (sigma-70 family)
MPQNAEEFIPTRRSLLHRLRNCDDEESWRDFFNIYWRLIFSVAIKRGLSDAEAQDVVQDTVISVARTMEAYRYEPERCSFKSWLRRLTERRIVDQFRRRRRESLAADQWAAKDDETAPLERLPDPNSDWDALWDAEWEKNLFETALQRAKRQATAEQFQIFDCYVLRKWPVKKVASTLGVNLGQVYLAKHRVSQLIKREIKKLEARPV